VVDRHSAIDDVVIVLREDGKYYDQDHLYLSELGNVLPNIGDTWTVHPPFGGVAAYRVVERYLSMIDNTEPQNNSRAWVLVVEQIEGQSVFEFDSVILRIFDAQVSNKNLAKIDALEDLDRTNRDPDYWTAERKKLLREERESRIAAINISTDIEQKN
jgi:hypothetical protein